MIFRKARENDVAAIVAMLADDELGQRRENFQLPLAAEYYHAFTNIDVEPNQELMVVENGQGEVVGTFQLSFLQYLTYSGGIRAQIEAVRIRKDQRGTGLGTKMMEWAKQRAKEKNAHVLQLTTDKLRPKAIAFYEQLGFKSTHEGMKLHFD